MDDGKGDRDQRGSVAAAMMARIRHGRHVSFSLDLRSFAIRQKAHLWAPERFSAQGPHAAILDLAGPGETLSQYARALGMTVLGVQARPKPSPTADEVHGSDELDQLWGAPIMLPAACPCTDMNPRPRDVAAFQAMKSSLC
jgi:phosphoglycerate dehydrogenase-like enzyme